MRVVIQRVAKASVTLPREGHVSGQIGVGLVAMCGLQQGDTEPTLAWMAAKVCGLRIFEDALGKMNLCVQDIPDGQVLLVPNFTVGCDVGKGRRPSFDRAMAPEEARGAFGLFVEKFAENGVRVQTGVFGAEMQVQMVNDGPVTFVLESPRRADSPAP